MNGEAMVQRAEAVARKAHEGQFRRDGTTPYIVHPEAVVGRVGEDPTRRAVAWLHDVVEDTDLTLADLEAEGFPPAVLEGVQLMTHDDGTPYRAYVERLRQSDVARAVKRADLLSNLADGPSDRQIVKYAQALLQLVDER